MANKDLRDWLGGVEAAGELKVIRGAEPKEEIGGIVDIYQRRMGNPAVMFDEVPGFPKGRRVLANILTSTLFKSRLEGVVADMAVDASYRAAPLVADAVRTVGYANAIDLIRGGPTAASSFLRQEMGTALIDAMVPGLGQALRVAQDPLIGQLLAGLTGVDVSGLATTFAGEVDNVIWGEIAREEAAIRADPRATRDPVLIGIFGTGAGF